MTPPALSSSRTARSRPTTHTTAPSSADRRTSEGTERAPGHADAAGAARSAMGRTVPTAGTSAATVRQTSTMTTTSTAPTLSPPARYPRGSKATAAIRCPTSTCTRSTSTATAPARTTSVHPTLRTDPARKPSTLSGSGANHRDSRYPPPKPRDRTAPAAAWEDRPGTPESQRVSATIGRQARAAPTTRARDSAVKPTRPPPRSPPTWLATTTPTTAPGKVACVSASARKTRLLATARAPTAPAAAPMTRHSTSGSTRRDHETLTRRHPLGAAPPPPPRRARRP